MHVSVPSGSGCDLGYCQNIHPGESWEAHAAALETFVPVVHAAVCADRPFGIGLRLGNRAMGQLRDAGRMAALRAWLERTNRYVFTLNGFPYGTFHGKAVKTDVYRPDWRSPQRLTYTLGLCEVMAQLVPPGAQGSISTVPGAYRAEVRGEDDLRRMAGHLAEAVSVLDRLSQAHGIDLHLGLEPEPDCVLETTTECLAFFETVLDRWAVPALARVLGMTRSTAAGVLRKRLGICVDACHAAVGFEDLETCLRTLHRQGLRISKVQLSAALRTGVDGHTRARLARFVNPVYLYQVRALTATGGDRVVARGDLVDALSSGPRPGVEREWRVHCHVPLYFRAHEGLHSTADALTPRVLQTALAAGVRHFEIETYTFDVLPETDRQVDLAASIVAEYRWVLERFFGVA